jgi:hypothetical protein
VFDQFGREDINGGETLFYFSQAQQWIEMSGQLQDLSALNPGEIITGTHWTGG